MTHASTFLPQESVSRGGRRGRPPVALGNYSLDSKKQRHRDDDSKIGYNI